MKLKLTEDERIDLIPNIRAVLETGEDWDAPELHHPAGAIIDAVASIDGVEKVEDEGYDSNGWQCDWWQKFTYRGTQYTLSGSCYYGGQAFHISDEQHIS